ncbi:hypothetical protein K502DRAFT_325520 [Neoconidiobolus thromboides FSU 785]|nr:hypothetical protein K502DRAFT_325520 [Neoconidiobolus thromboides FSU 785]
MRIKGRERDTLDLIIKAIFYEYNNKLRANKLIEELEIKKAELTEKDDQNSLETLILTIKQSYADMMVLTIDDILDNSKSMVSSSLPESGKSGNRESWIQTVKRDSPLPRATASPNFKVLRSRAASMNFSLDFQSPLVYPQQLLRKQVSFNENNQVVLEGLTVSGSKELQQWQEKYEKRIQKEQRERERIEKEMMELKEQLIEYETGQEILSFNFQKEKQSKVKLMKENQVLDSYLSSLKEEIEQILQDKIQLSQQVNKLRGMLKNEENEKRVVKEKLVCSLREMNQLKQTNNIKINKTNKHNKVKSLINFNTIIESNNNINDVSLESAGFFNKIREHSENNSWLLSPSSLSNYSNKDSPVRSIPLSKVMENQSNNDSNNNNKLKGKSENLLLVFEGIKKDSSSRRKSESALESYQLKGENYLNDFEFKDYSFTDCFPNSKNKVNNTNDKTNWLNSLEYNINGLFDDDDKEMKLTTVELKDGNSKRMNVNTAELKQNSNGDSSTEKDMEITELKRDSYSNEESKEATKSKYNNNKETEQNTEESIYDANKKVYDKPAGLVHGTNNNKMESELKKQIVYNDKEVGDEVNESKFNNNEMDNEPNGLKRNDKEVSGKIIGLSLDSSNKETGVKAKNQTACISKEARDEANELVHNNQEEGNETNELRYNINNNEELELDLNININNNNRLNGFDPKLIEESKSNDSSCKNSVYLNESNRISRGSLLSYQINNENPLGLINSNNENNNNNKQYKIKSTQTYYLNLCNKCELKSKTNIGYNHNSATTIPIKQKQNRMKSIPLTQLSKKAIQPYLSPPNNKKLFDQLISFQPQFRNTVGLNTPLSSYFSESPFSEEFEIINSPTTLCSSSCTDNIVENNLNSPNNENLTTSNNFSFENVDEFEIELARLKYTKNNRTDLNVYDHSNKFRGYRMGLN